jgi:hypothetical protein
MNSTTLYPTVKMVGTNMTFSYTSGIIMKDFIYFRETTYFIYFKD